jgi:hypothetical protein
MTAAPSKLTTEQWKRVETALYPPSARVDLEIDGYQVSLRIRSAGGLKFQIVPLVNGEFKVEWLFKDCEERRRFARPTTRPLYSPARIAQITKSMGKRRGKQFADELLSGTITHYWYGWPSFGALKRHLIKHNTSIRLLAIDGLGEPEL